MKTEQEFKSVRTKVLKLLAKDIKCRNDDKWLTYRVMREFTNIYIPFQDFKKIPAFETIKRCRAVIQNKEKRFKPTLLEVRKRRKMRERRIKDIVELPQGLKTLVDYNTGVREVTRR